MNQAGASNGPSSEVQNQIDADLVETLFETRGSFFAALIGGLLTPILAFYMTGDNIHLLLFALMVVLALYRLYVFYAHTRSPHQIRRRAAARWETLYAIGGVGFVTLLGLTTAIVFIRQHLDLAFCYSLVTMMAGVGALSGRNAGSPNIVFVQLIGLCGPLALATLFDPNPQYRWLALILVLETISIKSVTEYQHKNLESALRNGYDAERNRKRLGLALNSMAHGLCMGDGNLQVSVVNNRVIEFFGAGVPSAPERLDLLAEAIGQNAGLTVAETSQFIDEWRSHAAMPHANVFSQRLGERVFDFRCEPAEDGGFVTVIEDVTRQRSVDHEMKRLARLDSLTGLVNRHQFQQRLEEGLLQASNAEDQLTLLNIDLDRFKDVNDTLGHSIGDELLRIVAARLLSETRPVDIVARLGGDEFCVILSPSEVSVDAERVAKRIISELRKPFVIEQHVITIDASVGIASAPKDTATAEGLMRFSDLALYRAKSSGRGRAVTFQAKMLGALEKRRRTEDELRCAFEREEFVLYYQPIVDARNRRVTCCESLMRWRHPVRGLVAPREFIRVAEETGTIVPLGEWALRRACREALTWPNDIRVAVNLSPRQFRQKNLVQMIQSALLDSGLAPDRLEIEITETTLMRDTPDVSRKINELVAFGVRLSLDDFGTGYSSLGYLNRFPVNTVKLDRSFTRRVTASTKTRAIVGAIVSLTRDLDIELVAEGVETLEQLAQLEMKNVYLIQGLLFSRPVPTEQLIPLLAGWRAAVALEHVA